MMPQSSAIYTVKELNEKIQELVSGEPWLGSLGVEGEITGLGRDKRGHMYFSLKDPSGVLSAVMFAGKQIHGLGFEPVNGDKVHAFGHIDVYVRDGKYQLYVDRLVRVGDGEVNARLERLIARLDAMGLFSQEYKKPVPTYPRNIGIVTAGAKAAISDIKAVAKRRDPYAQLICYPATVQGQYAAADISHGIEVLDAMGLDLIIVGRGGGSREDLWAFNEEQVAWAIFNAETPIISATGHEIDTTVADMVADRRESNPSTAVMHALPVVADTVAVLEHKYEIMTALMENRLERLARMLDSYDRQIRLLSPEGRLDKQKEQIDRIEIDIRSAMRARLDGLTDRLDGYGVRIDDGMHRKYEKYKNALDVMTERIHGLSPTAKLVGGYGYISSAGDAVRSAADADCGDEINITLHDGSIQAVVSAVHMEE